MFSLAALNVIGSSSLRLSRSFSSSTVNWFPKLKTHQGAKKRWKALSNSGFKRAHACHSHLNVCKSPNRKNHLAQTAYNSSDQVLNVTKSSHAAGTAPVKSPSSYSLTPKSKSRGFLSSVALTLSAAAGYTACFHSLPGAIMSPRSSSESTSSRSSSRSSDSEPSGLNSTSALILVRNSEEVDRSYALSDDEEYQEEGFKQSELVLPPSVVFGYFLSPCLKLGAMLVLSSQASLKVSVPALAVFSFLSIFSRQIWFLLARYVKKSDVGDIVAEAVARGRRKAEVRSFTRTVSRIASGLVRLLLATLYLRRAIDGLEPLWPEGIFPISSKFAVNIVYLIILIPITLAPSLESRRLIYSTGLSNILYIGWLCGVIYAHARGALNTDTVMLSRGRLFQDTTIMAFAFSSLSTLQLYSGLVGSQVNNDKKEKRYLSISSISFYAALVGTALILPLLFPSVKFHGTRATDEDSILIRDIIATLTSFILLLGIPSLLTSSPTIPLPTSLRRYQNRPLGRYLNILLLFLLSTLPQSLDGVLEDIVVITVLMSTYFLPALLHIILHNMRSPLSIIVQPQSTTPRVHPDSDVDAEDDEGGVYGRDRDTEELLLRKERALQRRRLGRRIMWDIGVWILLVPVGGGGFVWSIGRIAGHW